MQFTPYQLKNFEASQLVNQGLTAASQVTPKSQQNFLSNYDDPYEVNSLADVILGTFNPKMKRMDLGGIEKIPILNIITSTVTDLLWDKEIKPIVEAKDLGQGLMASGLNLLTNFGETLGAPGNVVKGALFEGGQGVTNALGWGDQGRKNYDFNTGNFLADMALETLTDPLTYVGGFGIDVAARKAAGQTERIIAEHTDDIARMLGRNADDVARIITPELRDTAQHVMQKAIRSFWEPKVAKDVEGLAKVFTVSKSTASSLQDKVALALEETLAAQGKRSLFRNVTRENIDDVSRQIITKLGDWFAEDTSYNVIKGMQTMFRWGDNVERTLTNATIKMSPVGLTYMGLKSLAEHNQAKFVFARNVMTKVQDNVVQNKVNLSTYSQQAQDDADMVSDAILDDMGVTRELYREQLSDAYASELSKTVGQRINDIADDDTLTLIEKRAEITSTLTEATHTNSLEEALTHLRNPENKTAILSVLAGDAKKMLDEIDDKMRVDINKYRKLVKDSRADMLDSYGEYYTIQHALATEGEGVTSEAERLRSLSAYKKIIDKRINEETRVLSDEVNRIRKLIRVASPEDRTRLADEYQKAVHVLNAHMALGDTYDDRFNDILMRVESDNVARSARFNEQAQAQMMQSFDNIHKALGTLTELDNLKMGLHEVNYNDIAALEAAFKEAFAQQEFGTARNRLIELVELYKAAFDEADQKLDDISRRTSTLSHRLTIEQTVSEYRKMQHKSTEELLSFFKRYQDARLNRYDFEIVVDDMDVYHKGIDAIQEYVHRYKDTTAHYQVGMVDELLTSLREKPDSELLTQLDHRLKEMATELTKDSNKAIPTTPVQRTITVDNNISRNELRERFERSSQFSMRDMRSEYIDKFPEAAKNPNLDELVEMYRQDRIDSTVDKFMRSAKRGTPRTVNITEYAPVQIDTTVGDMLLDELFDTFHTVHGSEAIQLKAAGASVWYRLQVAKQEVTRRMVDSQEIQTIIHPDFIKRVSEYVDSMADGGVLKDNFDREVLPILLGLQDYDHFEKSLYANDFLRNYMTDPKNRTLIIQNITDTMHSFAFNNIDYLQTETSQKSFVDRFINKLTENINAYTQTKKNDVDALLKEYDISKQAIEDALQEAGLQDSVRHSAQGDLMRQYMVTQEIIKRGGIKLDEATVPILLDLEATGLHASADGITELAWMDMRNPKKVYSYTIKVNEVPDDAVLYLSYADRAIPGETVTHLDASDYAGLRKRFDYFNEHAQFADREAAFKQMQDDLQAVRLYDRTDGTKGLRNITRIGHNSDVYDAPFLKHEWNVAMMHTSYPNVLDLATTQTAIDTLIEARKLKGWAYINEDAKTEIRKEIAQFLNNRVKHTADSTYRATVMQPMEHKFFTQLADLANKLEGQGLSELYPTVDELRMAHLKLTNVLQEVKRTNDSFRHMGILKDEIPATYGNISQFARAIDDAYVGRTIASATAIHQFFNITDELVPETRVVDLFEVAEKLAYMRDNITAPRNINERVVKDMLDKMPIMRDKLIEKQHRLAPVYKMMRISSSDDIRTIYSEFMYFVQQWKALMQYDKQMNTDFIKLFMDASEHTIQLVAHPWSVTGEAAARRIESLTVNLRDDTEDVMIFLDEIRTLKRNAEDLWHAFEMKKDVHQLWGKGIDLATQKEIVQSVIQMADRMDNILDAPVNVQREFLEQMRKHNDIIATMQVLRLSKLSPEEFSKELWQLGKVGMVIDATDMSKEFKDALAELERTTLEGKHGVIMKRLSDDADTIYFGVDKAYAKQHYYDLGFKKSPGFEINYNMPESATVGIMIKDMETGLNDITQGAIQGGSGILLTQDKAQHLYNMLPEEIRRQITDVDELQRLGAFDGMVFHYSYIGNQYKRSEYIPYAARNPIKNYIATAQHAMHHADSISKYRMLWFNENSMYRLDNFFKATLNREATPEEIFSAIKNSKDATVAWLVDDAKSKLGYRVTEMPIRLDTIKHAMATKNGIIISKADYAQMAKILNDMEISNSLVKMFAKWVVNPLKASYLASMGWVMRNFIDTSMKAVLDAGSIPDSMRSTIDASYWYNWYTKLFKRICENSKSGMMDAEAAMDVLRPLTEDDRARYRMLHKFIQGDAGGGQLREVLQKFQGAGERDFIDKVGDQLSKAMWTYNPLLVVGAPIQEHIERIGRLSTYLNAVNHGDTYDEAISRVFKTHFNFNRTEKWQMYADILLPFSNFTLNNLQFWADMIDKHAWVAVTMRDILMPMANLDEYDQYELNQNRSLQYHIMAGNAVDTRDNTVYKLGLSIMDAYSTLIDPVNTLESRLVAPLRLPLEAIVAQLEGKPWDAETSSANIWSNVPVVGSLIQRYYGLETNRFGQVINNGSAIKAYERTGNAWTLIAPSFVGATYRIYYFHFPNSDVIYSTTDKDKYMQFLKDGAMPVRDQDDADALARYTPTRKSYRHYIYAYGGHGRRVYARKSYRKRYRKPRRYFAKKSYIPKAYAQAYLPNRWGRIRSHHTHVSVNNYKKMYTRKGKSRWEQRLMPYTPYTLKYRMRMSWSYLR